MQTETTTIKKETKMEQMTPPPSEIQMLIENALLKNNELTRANWDSSLEKFSTKMSADMTKQTEVFAKQVFTLTTEVTTHTGEIAGLKSTVSSIKHRIAVVGSACTALGGLLGFFISQLVNKQ